MITLGNRRKLFVCFLVLNSLFLLILGWKNEYINEIYTLALVFKYIQESTHQFMGEFEEQCITNI